MPELPEVETMRRCVLPIIGATITRAARTRCLKKPISISPRIDALNRRVQGRTIVSVDRLGKRVVLRLDSDERLLFEPRMTGVVQIGEPPNLEHLRFELTLNHSPANRLLFWDRRGLGRIELLRSDQYEAKTNGGTLGPDAIEISADELRQRARTSRREIKVALLDQKLIAGVGNLYASELLHVAGIDPRARCHRLTGSQWARLHTAMQCVLEMAIIHEGSTLSDGTYQKALGEPGGYQNHHRVYDRTNIECLTCHQANICRIVQAQRSTFFCPACQKKR